MKSPIEINDPLHGFIRLSEVEAKIIDSNPYQRLRRVKQLSGGHFVYPTAEHTRFGHCLGAMYLAGMLAERILPSIDAMDSFQEVRVAALLHDLGHGPFSHVFEDVLLEKRNMNHEDVTEWMIRESEVGDVIESYGLSKHRIADLVRGRRKTKIDGILSGIVAGQIDVDKMDYLIRDSFYCGVHYGLVDIHRLISSMEVSDTYEVEFDINARGAIESFLVARYEMFLNVYFHKAVRAVEVMFVKLMKAADSILNLTTFSTPEEFFLLDDISFISRVRKINPADSEDAREARAMMTALDSRRLYKSCFEKILHTEDRFVSKVLTKEKVRASLEEEIAAKAGVPPEDVLVDVPTLPSVPYNPYQSNPMEIRIFEIIDGKKVSRNLSELSNIAEMMKVYFDLIRVYTYDKHRKEVGRAAREIFQQVPEAAMIHM